MRISPKDAKRFFEAIDPRLLNENSNWSVYGYTPMRDRRGERNQAGKDSIWGFLSRKFIFLRSISRFAGKTSLVINRPPGVSVADYFRKHFMGGKERETDKLLDYLYVWKCGCAARHEVIYPTIESLPDTDGRHGACPNCGAAPLEVKTWKV